MQLVGLNPTDTQIQNLINEKEYDGESVSIYIFQLVTGSMCIGRKKLLDQRMRVKSRSWKEATNK